MCVFQAHKFLTLQTLYPHNLQVCYVYHGAARAVLYSNITMHLFPLGILNFVFPLLTVSSKN